jgi:hypothetical protein
LSIERKPLSKKKIHVLIKNRAASSAKKINPTLLLDSVKQPQLISSPLTTAKTAPKLKTQINKNMIILPL